jgi:hypothetical protein
MKKIIMVLIALSLTACSTVRTRNSDPVMRVAIDADSMAPQAYVRLQNALFMSGKFTLVDRAAGFKAMAKEQEIEHGTTRFGANEKYALWSKMYGVGGIFIGNEECKQKRNIFGKILADCTQNLTLINATTGEVMAIGEEIEESNGIEPQWNNTVEAMLKTYPHTMIDAHNPNLNQKYDDALVEYRDKTVPANSKSSTKMNADDLMR